MGGQSAECHSGDCFRPGQPPTSSSRSCEKGWSRIRHYRYCATFRECCAGSCPAADLILIPCRPAILDLRAISSTIDLVKLAGKPAAVVLNAVPPRGSLPQEAKEAIAGYGVPVASVYVGQRAAFAHALTAGLVAQEYEPGGKAAEEATQLYMWICIQVGVYEHNQETKPRRGAARG